MKRKVMFAVLLLSACLAAGCSSSKKETEAPAKVETEAKTEAATEAKTETEEKASEAGEEAAEEAAEAAAEEEASEEAAEAAAEEEASEEAEAVSEAEEAALEAAFEEAEAVSEAEEAGETEIVDEEAISEAEEAAEALVEEAVSEAEEAVEAAVEEASEAEEAEESALEEGTEAIDAEEETEAPAVIVELGERPEYNALDYVTVGTYKGLLAEVTKAEVSDDDVQSEMDFELESIVEEKELFEKVTDGTVADGDIVNIDYEGKIDGEAFDGGTGTYDLEIGSGSFIPGFEEQLIGMNVGDTIDINVTFPDSYYEELAGKDAVFTVTANYIKKTPEISDELVSKATDGEYETIDAYREHVKEQLTEQAVEAQKSEAYNELMTQLYNTFAINSLPEDLVDYSVISARNQYIQMAEMYGMTYEDMVAMYGVDEETFEGYLKDDIEASLKQEMILKAIAEEESMTLSEEEYKEGAQRYADAYGYESLEAFEEAFPRTDIESSLLLNKVMEFVYDNAVITEVEPETDEDELLFAEVEDETDDEEVLIIEEEDETGDEILIVEEEDETGVVVEEVDIVEEETETE